MRNLQEQVKKAFCYQKLFWPFTVWINCSSDLKNFVNSWPSAWNFKSFSWSQKQCFLTVLRSEQYQFFFLFFLFSIMTYFLEISRIKWSKYFPMYYIWLEPNWNDFLCHCTSFWVKRSRKYDTFWYNLSYEIFAICTCSRANFSVSFLK